MHVGQESDPLYKTPLPTRRFRISPPPLAVAQNPFHSFTYVSIRARLAYTAFQLKISFGQKKWALRNQCGLWNLWMIVIMSREEAPDNR